MSPQAQRAYLSGAALEPGTPGTITITVGTTEPRPSWTIPKTLLAERSHVFKSLFNEDTKVSDKHLPAITPNAFANFADYIRSSIYSTNTQVTGYNDIHAHVDACILGAQLGADEYRKAALRSLHALFTPGAHASNWNASRSIVGAKEMQYVCEHTSAATLVFAPCVTDIAAMMRGLRYLCYDALASHWTQRNVIFFSSSRSSKLGWGLWRGVSGASSSSSKQIPPLPPPRSTWSDLFERFPEFRERIVKTSDVAGLARARLLKDVKEYYLVFRDEDSDTSGLTSDSGSDDDSDSEGCRKLRKMFKSREGKSDAAPEKRQKLTLKLKGLGGTREGGVRMEEQESRQTPEADTRPQHIENIDTQTQEMGTQTDEIEEDMTPQYIEDIDADGDEGELPVIYRVDAHEGDRVMPE
ncbi:uncharacterized protein yc1106_01189 [Curvularia clavata]|uniref:BTB domain-containing protein n=1 Tax=Curvularia clavata TaxID=95742 RepID=A0A9Q9DP89_CURCL|nr:uncharacterized protein yc1106_01189 [Curvularia clavata]